MAYSIFVSPIPLEGTQLIDITCEMVESHAPARAEGDQRSCHAADAARARFRVCLRRRGPIRIAGIAAGRALELACAPRAAVAAARAAVTRRARLWRRRGAAGALLGIGAASGWSGGRGGRRTLAHLTDARGDSAEPDLARDEHEERERARRDVRAPARPAVHRPIARD